MRPHLRYVRSEENVSRVAEAVAREVEEAAYRTGVARRERSRADAIM